VGGEVELLTSLLRSSEDPMWSALRAALRAAEVDVDRSYLASSVQQGDDSEFAVLVDRNGAVFLLSWQPSTAVIFERVDVTGWWTDSPYRAAVQEALDLRARE
jgi:hypothetical protein